MTTTTQRIRQLILSAAIALVSVAGVQTLAATAPIQVTGTAGKAAQHASFNFKAIAIEEALGPMPLNEHRTILRPVAPRIESATESEGAPAAPESEAQAPAMSTLQSLPPVNSFAAVADNGTVIPPDAEGAIGPHHLMEALNSQVVIQDRSGNVLSAITNWTFWSSLGVTESFDAHVLYDPYAQRWIFSSAAGEMSSNGAILIGVSQTSDPTAGWNIYKINLGSSVNWVDYPTLGFNKNWIVVQANIFTIAGNNFVNSTIWAFDKADLYAGGTGKYTVLTPTDGFTQVPATTMDPNLSTMYLLEQSSPGSGKLRVDTITGPVGSEVLTSGVAYPTGPSAWQEFSPVINFAPQLGSSENIDTEDGRIQSCVYRNGSLWASHTVYLPATGTPTRTAAQWWQINMSASALGQVQQFGRIDDPTAANFYAFPTLAVNQYGDVMLGYAHFGDRDICERGLLDAPGERPSEYDGKRGDAEGGRGVLLQGLRHRREPMGRLHRYRGRSGRRHLDVDDPGVRRSKQYVGYVVGLDNPWRVGRDADSGRDRDARPCGDADAQADRDTHSGSHTDSDTDADSIAAQD